MVLITLQKFVAQVAMIPNLKLDYVILNAGVLKYPNVSPAKVIFWKDIVLIYAEGY